MPVSTAAIPAHGYVKVHARHLPAIQDEHMVFSPSGLPLGLFFFYRSPSERAFAIRTAWGHAIELQGRFDLRFEVSCWEGKELSTVDYAPGSLHA